MNKAFTLIELIIVIVLLGILAATALPRFVDFSEDAREAERQSIGAQIRTSLSHLKMLWYTNSKASNISLDINNDLHFHSDGYIDGINSSGSAVATADWSHSECSMLLSKLTDRPESDFALYGSGEGGNCASTANTTKDWCVRSIGSPYSACYFHYMRGTTSPKEYQYTYCYGTGNMWATGETCTEGGLFRTRKLDGSWTHDPY